MQLESRLTRYDYIIAGGGAAGLSLAYHLVKSSLKDKKILIIEKESKTTNDRTWCFWDKGPSFFPEIHYRRWNQFRFTTCNFSSIFNLAPLSYFLVRSGDYYNFIHSTLSRQRYVEIRQNSVERIWDDRKTGFVQSGGQIFSADWVFDSRLNPVNLQSVSPNYHAVKQHFLGWEIETSQDIFDPSTPTLFDFRTPQLGSMRFLYILPFSTRNALVEYTLFSPQLLSLEEYEKGLRDYLSGVLGLESYHVSAVEKGIIPMTDYPFPRQVGTRILNIGTRGGRVKPSTGYAFHRIQKDSLAIVRSLEETGQPFQIPLPPPRYHLFDSMLLQILQRYGELGEIIFTRLFTRNPVERIFRFLDENGSIWENLLLMASVPPLPFIRAWYRLKILRRI
jgi:lycopene beta-cyclase